MTLTRAVTTNHEIYRAARDRLLELRCEHERAVAEFTWPSFEEPFNWAHDWFDAIARGNTRVALRIVETTGLEHSYTFDDMARRSDRLAAQLGEWGVRRGDSVLIMLGNQVELWESMLAVMKLGAVIMPATTALGAIDLPDRIRRGGARYVITNGAEVGKFADVGADLTRIVVGGSAVGWIDYPDTAAGEAEPLPHPGTRADDRLLLYFTSGTTSRPKLVEHTQQSYPVGHLTTMYWLGLQPGDVHLNISSPGWAKHAWSMFFAPWIAESTIFVYNHARFDARALLDCIRRAEVTTFCAPPTVWRMLIKADLSEGPGALRQVIAAGEPLNPEVIEQVRAEWGLTLRDGFGQTETTASVGNTPGSLVKPGSMGRPLPGVPVVLIDTATGEPTRGEGEICVDLSARPPSLMRGYLDDDDRNAEVMRGGYYHTGDVATVDDHGYLFYLGRTDDVFKASDYKVSPFELESVLVKHPAVTEAAVVPAPDEMRLAVPKAYIQLTPGWSPDRITAVAILRHARENLAPYLRVRRIEFCDLPKTISGKIRRVELRAREENGTASFDEWRDSQFPELFE